MELDRALPATSEDAVRNQGFDVGDVFQVRLPMTKICWLPRLSNRLSSPGVGGRFAGSIGVAILLLTTGIAAAQTPAPEPQPVTAPNGYTVHQAIDLGGRIANINGSGAMYDTLVNEQSGPRVFGETFVMRALPATKNTPFDTLTAVGNGFGGDPYSFAKLDFYKSNLYEFSGLFRRDRQYFDYDLLGNPNIPSGQSVPIGPTGATTGSLPYSQVNQSPFLFNTVRRMTDTSVTFFPLAKVTYRVAYSHNTFEGPSLTPSGYQFASSYDVLLEEYQRNGTDNYTFGVDYKPVQDTRLTLEEQIDHYKADSFFTMDPAYVNVQEPDGTKVALLMNYDSLTPYASSACNANSVGTTPVLSAPTTAGGLPVVNPACAVISSYVRSQPTRFFYPTEIFRFQSSHIRNLSMNGDARYTYAKMSMPNYYENFQGLTKTTRSLTYTANGNAKREVMAADYGIVWQAARTFSLSDQISYSSVQQPGSTTMTSLTTVSTAATANNETINSGTTSTPAAGGASTFEGSGSIGVPLPDFFGQRRINNDLTATWDGWSRATISLTYRHSNHLIGEGIPHNAALASGATTNGTVTINQDGGVLNIALRPTSNWDINGSAEMMYADNVFTPVAPRELQHYRVHTLYRLKSWATVSSAYNDLERHNNTNNTGAAPLDGPLDHVDHSRTASFGAQLNPTEHYGLDINYSYTDVYASTNICYLAGASATLPGASTLSGTACPSPTANRGGGYDMGPTRDFMDAPTNYGSAALRFSPSDSVKWGVGYRISSVDGSRFYNDARDVAGSLVSKYQSPFVNVAWTARPGWIWKAEYQYYGYGEGGPSGATYCTTANPSPTTPSPVSYCGSVPQQTGLNLPSSGETAPRTFRANNITLGFHYEF
jgi:hypothetical protein